MAESCTGGLAGALLTEASGASVFFRGAIVAYADEIKSDLLGVPTGLLYEHGAVSQPCVECMAHKVAERLGSQVGWALSGVAGPNGGSSEKPVGLCWQATWHDGQVAARQWFHQGTRAEIRLQAILEGAEWLATWLET